MTDGFQVTLCRMHESPVPAQHQYVLCRVDRSHDIGFYIHLLEWNNTEALLPASSIAQRRIKNINSYLRPGQEITLEVARIDVDRGYIDLDERSVTPQDKENCKIEFYRNNTIHTLMRHLALLLKIPKLIVLYKVLGWPSAAMDEEQSVYNSFRNAVTSFDRVFKQILDDYYEHGYIAKEGDYDLTHGLVTIEELNAIKDTVPRATLEKQLKDQLNTRLRERPVKLSCDISVTICRGILGIETIKDALREGLKYAAEHPITTNEESAQAADEQPLSIKMHVAPIYTISIQTIYQREAKELINSVCKVIEANIVAAGGRFSVDKEVAIVTPDKADK